MASSQQPTTIDNLQGDVLSEIFIRLLAKQLAQMRCVSNNDDILLFFKSKFSFCGGRPFTACPSRSPHHELTDFIKLPVNLQSRQTYGNVIGSVNGLICFNYGAIHDTSFYIWNPSLSVVLTLPPSLFPSHDTDYLRIPPRFGFDPKSDDYKVTKFTRDPQLPLSACLTLDIDDCIETVDYKVEVYSMRKGIWQLVPHRFPSHLKILRAMHYKEFCVDGHVHWFDYADSFWKVQNIVAFDLGEETFREMPLPDLQMVATQFSLGVLGGKLCVMFGIRYHGCEVWVMDEYGVAESWVKRYVFSEFDDVIIPYGFTFHNEFLYEVANYFDNEDDHCLGLYNPIAAKTKSFEVGYGLSKVVEYVDSLVWVAPVEHELSCCNISRLKI
ncbi:F-box/kelch-repeat protein At3g23880 [Lactuca sativa]|uniref:F-box/kelch-repeat protein At3g23880 n=1 Tax=Lactuca sativa TaxID=4236 RepID=UPI000CAA6C76|nr:F-box/kelch-repeat protein At3g23880 [Lactuca sativa]